MKAEKRIASSGFVPLAIMLAMSAEDGEVDAAGQDDEGHAKGDERIDGDLTSQIFQVRRIDEAVIQSRDNNKEYNETNERPHFSHKIFNFFGIHAYSPPVANVIIRVCVASL